MTKLIETLKAPFVFVLFGAMIIFSCLGLNACAGMYNERGELTEQTQNAIRSTTETAKTITDVVAPQASPFVSLGGAAVGSLLTLIGACFYNKQNKGGANV